MGRNKEFEGHTVFNKYGYQLLGEILCNVILDSGVLVKTSASKEKMHTIANFFLESLSN